MIQNKKNWQAIAWLTLTAVAMPCFAVSSSAPQAHPTGATNREVETKPKEVAVALELPSDVRVALGVDETQQSYVARTLAASRLPNSLRPDAQTAVLAFLKCRRDAVGLNQNQLNALKNDLAEALMAQASPLPRLDAEFAKMYRDATEDTAWRDYCIQFLGPCYAKAQDPAVKQEILKVLNEAMREKAGAIAATAMLALYRNAVEPEVRTETAGVAAAAAADAAISPGVRATALQVAANLGHHELLPTARGLAQDEKVPAPLRMSAIAAIGTLGDESDRAMLDTLLKGNDMRLHVAIKSALKRLGTGRKYAVQPKPFNRN